MVFKSKRRRGRKPSCGNVISPTIDAVEGLLLLGQQAPVEEFAFSVEEEEKGAGDDSILADLAAELNIDNKWQVETLECENVSTPSGKSAIASPSSSKWKVTPLKKTPQRHNGEDTGSRNSRRSLNFGGSPNAFVDDFLHDDVRPLPVIEEEAEEVETSNGEDHPFFIFEDVAVKACPCIWKEDCSSCSPCSPIKIVNPKIEDNVTWRKKILSFELCSTYPKKEFYRLTGITITQFHLLLDLLGRDTCEHLKYEYKRGTPSKIINVSKKLSIEDRLLMTLLRLRRGWDLDDIGLLFGVSEGQASKVVYTWLQFMYYELKRLEPAMFVSRHVQKEMGLPPPFKPFPNFRVILDTTEVRIEAPEDFMEQGNTYSDYKGGNVIMYLIGASCWGSVSYVSPGFEGSISDVELYRRSGIREFLEEGDLLLVDRGFRIQEECDEDNVMCVHPPFLKTRDKYTPEEEQLKREIAKARIYVEHVNRKIKVFKILKQVRNTILPYLDQIVYIIGFLVNLQTPHVKTTLEKQITCEKK